MFSLPTDAMISSFRLTAPSNDQEGPTTTTTENDEITQVLNISKSLKMKIPTCPPWVNELTVTDPTRNWSMKASNFVSKPNVMTITPPKLRLFSTMLVQSSYVHKNPPKNPQKKIRLSRSLDFVSEIWFESGFFRQPTITCKPHWIR